MGLVGLVEQADLSLMVGKLVFDVFLAMIQQ